MFYGIFTKLSCGTLRVKRLSNPRIHRRNTPPFSSQRGLFKPTGGPVVNNSTIDVYLRQVHIMRQFCLLCFARHMMRKESGAQGFWNIYYQCFIPASLDYSS